LSTPTLNPESRKTQVLEKVVVRFAGDSGDGVQLTGEQFTKTSALAGNEFATLPNFPAEIRAPAGTLFGVSGYQIQFGAIDIRTPGDAPDVLVAFNPAALKTNLKELKKGGMILANTDAFNSRNLEKAGYTANPLEDGSLDAWQLVKVDIGKLNREALREAKVSARDKDRAKNFFALGMVYYLYTRPIEHTVRWIEQKFAKDPDLAAANVASLKAGFHYSETVEVFLSTFEIPQARIAPGLYRNLNGNTATALGLVTAARKAGIDLFLGSYPITPASDLLHTLAGMKAHGVRTFQAEDEIAAITSALGASYAGQLGVCSTSGPGLALKGEALGLGLTVELPLVVVDVQRAGPSTGMPTKTEQADLNIALFGRHGESPLPVLAACTPADCFDAAFEAARIAIKYRTPVILLTDGYLANGSEPWAIPDADSIPSIACEFRKDPENFQPYARNPGSLARPWVKPGTPGLEHRIGGIEKEDGSGHISYDPNNHHRMCELRREKVMRVRQEMGPTQVFGDPAGELLLIGWGGTKGAIATAVEQARAAGKRVSAVHLRWLNPLPGDLGDVIARFDKVLVPEINLGQLIRIIRSEYLVDAKGFNKVRGLPIHVGELCATIDAVLYGEA
jgi:2-oxoglutarate ferredoxin oxidoreductase subunit alpha